MVRHEIQDDFEAEGVSLFDQVFAIGKRAEAGIDIAIIGDVIAEIGHRRWVERADPDGVHAELRRLGVKVTRFVEDFMGARLPNPEEERALQLPSGVPVTRNIRTAYAGDQPVEVMDTISHGEVVSHRFNIEL